MGNEEPTSLSSRQEIRLGISLTERESNMNILIQQSLTLEQRLQKAVSDIMMNDKYIALAGLLAMLVPKECTDLHENTGYSGLLGTLVPKRVFI